jgi:hypothetical protein
MTDHQPPWGPHGQPSQPGQQQPWQPQGQPGFTPAPSQRARKRPGRGLKIVGAIVYSVVVLFIGVAIGSAGSKPATPAATSATATQNSPAPAATTATTQPAAAAAPVSHVLIRFAGSGIRNSAPFNVGSGPLTVTYHFDCSSQGQAGNFAADLQYGNQGSLNSDDQPIANDLALHGGQTTTIYPQDPGQQYYLSVNSECDWHITVRGS